MSPRWGLLGVSVEFAGVWLAGVGLAVLLAVLASTARSYGAPVATLAVLAVGAYFARAIGLGPGLVVLLIVTATADRFTFPVGALAIRAEQIAALAALVALFVTAFRERRWEWLKPNLAEVLLLAWLATNVMSSLLASPDRRLSAKILAVIGISSLGLFLPRRLLSTRSGVIGMETVVRWLMIAFATEAGYATIVYLIHALGPTISIGVNPASSYLGAYGTLWEQNVLGGFSAAGVVAWAYLGPRRSRSAWLGTVACLGGLVVSVTRAAWLATVLVAAMGLLFRRLRQRLDWPSLARAAAGGLGVIGATLVAARFGTYYYPLAPVAGSGGTGVGGVGFLGAMLNRVDILGRFNQLPLVWDDIRNHLVFGRGTAAFESLHQFKSVPEHLASLPLNVVDGTGLFGLALFSAFAIAVLIGARRQRQDEFVGAFGQVAFVIALTNISTETTELMVGWLLIGLLLSAVDSAAQGTQIAQRTDAPVRLEPRAGPGAGDR